jgi:hypothetical protein
MQTTRLNTGSVSKPPQLVGEAQSFRSPRKGLVSYGSSQSAGSRVHLGRLSIHVVVIATVLSQHADPVKMKTQSTKNSSSKSAITAANLEVRFDAGDDVLDYFDLARASVTHGGARSGAGRKPTGKLRKTVKLSPATIRRLQAYARRNKLPNFSAAIEAASCNL